MPPFSRHCSVTFGLDNAAASFGARIIMAYQNNTNSGFSSSLRAADSASKPSSRLAAGPFDVSSASRENETASLPDALITGMLVVYPVVATVVAAMVGLVLAGPVV
jgi:hypothetical protein